MSEDTFHEEQQFRQPWLWWVMGLSILTSVVITIFSFKAVSAEAELGAGMIAFTVLFSAGIVGICLWFLIACKLTTEVRADGVYYKFFPFILKYNSIQYSDIEEVFERQYHPIREYGGWGLRWGIGKVGRALNIRGDRGVQFVLKNGKRILIGSQKSQEFFSAIEAQRKK